MSTDFDADDGTDPLADYTDVPDGLLDAPDDPADYSGSDQDNQDSRVPGQGEQQAAPTEDAAAETAELHARARGYGLEPTQFKDEGDLRQRILEYDQHILRHVAGQQAEQQSLRNLADAMAKLGFTPQQQAAAQQAAGQPAQGQPPAQPGQVPQLKLDFSFVKDQDAWPAESVGQLNQALNAAFAPVFQQMQQIAHHAVHASAWAQALSEQSAAQQQAAEQRTVYETLASVDKEFFDASTADGGQRINGVWQAAANMAAFLHQHGRPVPSTKTLLSNVFATLYPDRYQQTNGASRTGKIVQRARDESGKFTAPTPKRQADNSAQQRAIDGVQGVLDRAAARSRKK